MEPGTTQLCNTHRPQVQLNLAPKVAEVHVELQLKKLQRTKPPWMEDDDDDTPSRPGNLLTPVAPALVTEPAAASAASAATVAAMAATGTEGAEVVQARSPPLSSYTPPTHAATHRAAQATPSCQHRCKWSSRREKPS